MVLEVTLRALVMLTRHSTTKLQSSLPSSVFAFLLILKELPCFHLNYDFLSHIKACCLLFELLPLIYVSAHIGCQFFIPSLTPWLKQEELEMVESTVPQREYA